jgi:hypothetical protein
MPGAGDANPYGRRCENTYCSSQQDEQGPLSYPDGSKLEFFHPISSSSSVKLNPTELRLVLIAIWLMFDLIPLDLILHWLRCCVRIISITATLVNVGVRFVRTIRFNFASAASMLRVVRCGCGCDCGCVMLARASENASSKIQQKLKKSKEPS